MKSLLLLGLAMILTLVALAQAACPEYSHLMQEAETYFQHSEYRKALYKYNTAKTCSPSRRPEVDSMINILFEKIELERKNAKAAEDRIRKIYDEMQEANNKLARLEDEKNNADSNRVVDKFRSRNDAWFKKLTAGAGDSLLTYLVWLDRMDRAAEIDSVASYFRLIYEEKDFDKVYMDYVDKNASAISWAKFPANKTGVIPFRGLRILDGYFYEGWEKIDHAMDLLPLNSEEMIRSQASRAYATLRSHRKYAVQNYWMPDTLIGLPSSALFVKHCSDNKNFIWAYSDYADFKKLQVHYLNLSVTDFSLTTDSLVALSDSGGYYDMLNAAGNYRYQVGRSISYTRKKNMVEYQKIEYASPMIRRLMDNRGNILVDFSKDSSTSYFFSSDASHLATWKDKTKLLLYDLKDRRFIPLPNAEASLTMSFSFDSRRIAYYNKGTKLIYIADLEGHVLEQIPSASTGITAIGNIDFTGGDGFLKINNDSSICLFDLTTRKPVMNFKKSFVDEIVVSPNKKDILVSCNTEYQSASDNKMYYGKLGVLIDAELNIKAKLYSGSSSFFFTPGGEYIIGYGETSIMRWPVGELTKTLSLPTCLSLEELVEYNCFPFARYAAIDDAGQIEKGARKLKDLANEEMDPQLKSLYYRQSRTLFDRLAYGNAKNIRKDRILFFYDWYNWIDSKLGNRNFRDQFIRIQSVVKTFDDLANSPDSVYPQLLYYAGYSHMMLASLYDSLGAYNNSFVGEIIKEISFRQRVFEKDPDNKSNIDYYTSAIRRLSDACDSVGLLDITNGQYADRLTMYRTEDSLLAGKIGILPDSFGLKPYYIDVLTQLGASYLYVYASRPKENANAPDSAIYYADKGLALSPGKTDSAKLLIVKARAYLLRPDGLDASKGLYREVMDHFPVFTRGSMLIQLQRLRAAGALETGNIRSIEELLKQEH